MTKDLRVEEDEILVSYDVTALYPSVPQEEAIDIFHQLMINDDNLASKTSVSAENVTALFKICVRTTYFAFNKKLYQQIDGLAIGASSSGFAAELFMEKLEKKALATFTSPPSFWRRYVDDTFAKLKMIYVDSFLEHLNNQHERINFTSELQQRNRLAFLDSLTHVLPDKTTKKTIFRKATHTDQYLDFNSNHHIKQKIGIISSFEHRIDTIITTEEDKKKERNHVKKALKRCGHPNWTLNRKKKQNKNKEDEKVERRGRIVLPYIKGTSEKLARIFMKFDIETFHKPTTKLKTILCNKMKDKVEMLDRTGAVYYNLCKKEKCNEKPKNDYVGETDRVLRGRQYEHGTIDHKTSKRSASIDHEESQPPPQRRTSTRTTRSTSKQVDYKALHQGSDQPLSLGSTEFSAHLASSSHKKTDYEFSILCTDDNWYNRGVKEAIAIRKLKPTLNQDDGRHHLSRMYDKLIYSSVTMRTPRQGTESVSQSQTDEGTRPGVERPL